VKGPAGRAVATPAPGEPREVLLRGEVVETACFVMAGRRGDAHRQCAIACARAGQNLGLYDESGDTLYVVVQDRTAASVPNPLFDYIATKVEVKGTAVERGGIHGLIVHSVRSLENPAAAK